MVKKNRNASSVIYRNSQNRQSQKREQVQTFMKKKARKLSPLSEYPLVSLRTILERAHAPLKQDVMKSALPSGSLHLFISISDGHSRAQTHNFKGGSFEAAWSDIIIWANKFDPSHEVRWLRIEWVSEIIKISWLQLHGVLGKVKRNYFRYGISLNEDFRNAFLEQELNANAMLYLGAEHDTAGLNEKNFISYGRQKYGQRFTLPEGSDHNIWLFTTSGLFFQSNHEPVKLNPFCGDVEGRDTGRRCVSDLNEEILKDVVRKASNFLANQVNQDGKFTYGLHPCFDREINTYNTLRHTSTLYSMLEAWDVTRDSELKRAIDRGISYLTKKLLRNYKLADGEDATFLLDLNNEIKLGGNAVCLLALVKYTELTGEKKYLPLMEKIASGIKFLQDDKTGQFFHVLHSSDLSVKEKFRIIYYDGEAAFGLMRLYGLTKDSRWLEAVEKAFEYFISNRHWRAHDHWLGYCVNELTLYKPEERYFQFGIDNFSDHLDFVEGRITTFPTLLELMMAAYKMIERLKADRRHSHLLNQIDLVKFDRALNSRALYLLNGYFFPEVAMFFKNPKRILGSFFIRHHSFRIRIDDVEHYLSGYIAYLLHYLPHLTTTALAETDNKQARIESIEFMEAALPYSADATLVWGGNVNLGRRLHYRVDQLGYENVLHLPELMSSDLSVVNLECVIATIGEQGIVKGEGRSDYFRARPEMLKVLTAVGVDVVAVANDHSCDYGAEALIQQRDILDAIGIASVGGGHDKTSAFSPIFCHAGELCVAIFNVDATQHRFAATPDAPGIAHLSLDDAKAWFETFKPLVDAARERADLVFIAVHWGANHENEPSLEEIRVGHMLIEAGFDAVMGASSHRLQGLEIYQNKPIIHGAGDLLCDAIGSGLSSSGLFRFGLTKTGISWLEFLPVGTGFGFSRRLDGDQCVSVIRDFVARSAKLGATLECREDRAVIKFDQVAVPDTQLQSSVSGPLRVQHVNRKRSYNTEVLASLQPSPTALSTSNVPHDARIAPMRLNGLILLGVQTRPKSLSPKQMLWVETWWTCESTPIDDLRLSYLAVPRGDKKAMPWGGGMDHDPCDWMLPTHLWKPGEIYRDFYGVCPPQRGELSGFPLQLEIRVIGKKPNSEVYLHPVLLHKAIEGFTS